MFATATAEGGYATEPWKSSAGEATCAQKVDFEQPFSKSIRSAEGVCQDVLFRARTRPKSC